MQHRSTYGRPPPPITQGHSEGVSGPSSQSNVASPILRINNEQVSVFRLNLAMDLTTLDRKHVWSKTYLC